MFVTLQGHFTLQLTYKVNLSMHCKFYQIECSYKGFYDEWRQNHCTDYKLQQVAVTFWMASIK